MKKSLTVLLIFTSAFLFACGSGNSKTPAGDIVNNQNKDTTVVQQSTASKTIADAATIMARKEVPVLCYHQIRDWTGKDSKTAKDIIVPIALFKAQLKIQFIIQNIKSV